MENGAPLSDGAAWYAEQLKCSAINAKRVSGFMGFVHTETLILKPEPWAKGDMTRIYFGLLSQNKLFAIEMLNKSFYDAGLNEIFIVLYGYGTWTKRTLNEIAACRGRSIFSGSKTRKEIIEFSRRFYEQKTHWD